MSGNWFSGYMINKYANEGGLLTSKCPAQMIGATIHQCYYLLVLQQQELNVFFLSELVENAERVSWEGGEERWCSSGSG